eukprot:CAMPEP_0182887954 /NCGR_PEP_ID=MMETSP0034_2-20130328/21138_1 /TAXON_ID=156128 /ORGANISM="Nephroselmis pyriformis, Strain CCMP717" /LENGTH=36 /DNA_ID= /DNA_START= /DNA_END= /DNA_ORIENTATION=
MSSASTSSSTKAPPNAGAATSLSPLPATSASGWVEG